MESSSANSSTGLEWENLAVYSNSKPIDNSQFAMNDFGSDQSSFEGFAKVHQAYSKSAYDPIIGLRLGTQQREYGHGILQLPTTKSSTSSVPVSSMPAKRSRASYQNMQNPCCQVEGCNLDLKSAKDYHRRHRICETHSKSPKVVVAGNERRFCQQCSRFHDLSEFDDKKRSCRRRLSDHNARRRRVQPESMQLRSTGLSPALYDQRKQNVLLSGLPISLTNPSWENVNNCMSRSQENNIHNSISNLHMESDRFSTIHNSNHRTIDQCLQVPNTTNSSIALDLVSAQSLLSSNIWSYNEGEPTSMDGLVSFRHSEQESHHMSLFQSGNVPVEQGRSVSMGHSGDLNNGGSSHHQEYQLFKAPYDSGGFYSSQRYL